jgi:hypothetical protein
MINSKYRKVSGLHKGHAYVVLGPYSEIETPMRWELQAEANEEDRQVVSESDLNNPALWQAIT